MRRLHVLFAAAAAVVGIRAAASGVWLTVAGMACVLASQLGFLYASDNGRNTRGPID